MVDDVQSLRLERVGKRIPKIILCIGWYKKIGTKTQMVWWHWKDSKIQNSDVIIDAL